MKNNPFVKAKRNLQTLLNRLETPKEKLSLVTFKKDELSIDEKPVSMLWVPEENCHFVLTPLGGGANATAYVIRGYVGQAKSAFTPAKAPLEVLKISTPELRESLPQQEQPYAKAQVENKASIAVGIAPKRAKVYSLEEKSEYGTTICHVSRQYLIPGENLADYLDSRRNLDFNARATIIQAVLAAARYQLNRGWAHLDLKPDNIMYDEKTNTAYIIDMGEAIYMGKAHELQVSNFFNFASTYSAPESEKNKTEGHTYKLHKNTDLYSLGKVVRAIMFGRESTESFQNDTLENHRLSTRQLLTKKRVTKETHPHLLGNTNKKHLLKIATLCDMICQAPPEKRPSVSAIQASVATISGVPAQTFQPLKKGLLSTLSQPFKSAARILRKAGGYFFSHAKTTDDIPTHAKRKVRLTRSNSFTEGMNPYAPGRLNNQSTTAQTQGEHYTHPALLRGHLSFPRKVEAFTQETNLSQQAALSYGVTSPM